MAGILDGIVRGIASLAPQDDPDVKIFNAQNELKDITEAEAKKRFCTECGAEVADGMKFCSGCGARQGE